MFLTRVCLPEEWMSYAVTQDEKAAALRMAHALNPRAALVSDPAFTGGNPFFDPRDLVQVKYELLRRVHTEGHSVTQAAAAFGLSRPSFYAAQRAWQQAGLAGLLPQRLGPRRAHKLNEEVVQFLGECLQREPGLPARALATRVADRFGLQVHPRSIERALVRQGNPQAARSPRRLPPEPRP
jgi:transposase